MISTNNINWIAGLLEGEGSFNFNGTPQIQIRMTDQDTIERFKSITKTDAQIGVYKHKGERAERSDIYYIVVGSSLAIQWMMTIYCLMSKRRKEQIGCILRLWKEMPGQGYTTNNILKRKLDIIKFVARQRNITLAEAQLLYEQISESK